MDIFPGFDLAQFLIYSQSPGWPAAKLQASFSTSPDLLNLTPGTGTFEDNISDLRPRNYLFVSAGANELPVSFTLDTTRMADGFHEVTLVGYEGTSVRTQTPVTRTIQVQNTSLSATLTAQTLKGSVILGMPFSISVTANTNAIAKIELFSTGGSLGVISNQQTVVFTVPTAILGVGLHPFCALVTDALGNQFRTQTTEIRITPSLLVTISGQPPTLTWPSIPSVAYDILSSTNPAGPFQKVGTVVATGSTAGWPVPVPLGQHSYFSVRVSQ
jgi:hypothetical protein